MSLFRCQEEICKYTFIGLHHPDTYLKDTAIPYTLHKSFSAFGRGLFIFEVEESPQVLDFIQEKKLLARDLKDNDKIDIDFNDGKVEIKNQ